MPTANSQKPTAKILLAAPISDYKDYVMADWIKHLATLEGNFDVMLVDNSKDENYWQKITPLLTDLTAAKGIHTKLVRVDPGKDTAQQFILRSRNEIRARFLQGDYTHLFSLECDVFPPKDVISRLMAANKLMVSGWYFVGQKVGSYPLFVMANVLPVSRVFNTYICSFQQSFLMINGKLVQTIGNGIGCSLIRREVIEAIPFRINADDVGFDDSFFNQDVWMKGIDHFCDTSLYCHHRNFNWQAVKEYQEVDKTTGKNKIINFSEYTPMEQEQIKSVVKECQDIIKALKEHQTTLSGLVMAINKEKQQTKLTFADNAMIDKKLFDATRELWDIQVEINAKEKCLKEYQARIK